MAGLIRRSDIDEVRSRVNIADVVGGYVTLKSAGVGSLKGLCPFHDERSPSFHVRPQVGRYHCFGCGEDGDVFSFLQRMDHCTFSEAVERLASGIGYQLRYEDGGAASSGVEAGARARILAANAAAAEFFVAQLSEPAAEPGRIFLGQRGFDPAAAQRFGVGFAPKSYTALVTHMATVGFSAEECLAAGLVGQGERGTYDRFRGRLVWPIRDVTGQTIGFGARKLLEDDTGPKYLNTPETAVYRKSQVLYGLDMAKRDISRNKQVVVVEGYTDVMACHLAGVTTAVATCGTAFGVDHIKLVRRVLGDFGSADARGLGEVVFTFDPDEAGQRAASRAFEEEQRFAAQTFVAVAPGGLDPCDLRLKRGDAAVRDMVARKKPMFEFMIRRVLAQYNLETVEGRVSALRASAPVVADIRDQSLSGGYVRTLAGWLGVDPGEVAAAVSAARSRGEAHSGRGVGPGGRPGTPHEAVGQPSHAGTTEAPDFAPPMLAQLPTDPVTRLERDALMAMVQQPEKVGVELLRSAAHTRFASESLAVVRDAIAGRIDEAGSSTWLDGLIADVPAPFATLVKELGVAPLPERSSREIDSYCRGVVKSLVERDLLRRKAELLGVLQRVDAVADAERYRATQSELVEVERQRRELQREDEI